MQLRYTNYILMNLMYRFKYDNYYFKIHNIYAMLSEHCEQFINEQYYIITLQPKIT